MGYLLSSSVMDTIKNERELSLLCYDDENLKKVVKFCYDSLAEEIAKLPQYVVENVVESNKKEETKYVD